MVEGIFLSSEETDQPWVGVWVGQGWWGREMGEEVGHLKFRGFNLEKGVLSTRFHRVHSAIGNSHRHTGSHVPNMTARDPRNQIKKGTWRKTKYAKDI